MTAIGSFSTFIDPLLRVLMEAGGPIAAREAYEAVADRVGLTADQRAELLPSGKQAVYKNRIGWAHDRLKRAGLSGSPKRGVWEVTESGRALVGQYPVALPDELIAELAFHPDPRRLGNDADEGVKEPSSPSSESGTPEDRLFGAFNEIRDRVRGELLDLIQQGSPSSSSTWSSTCSTRWVTAQAARWRATPGGRATVASTG